MKAEWEIVEMGKIHKNLKPTRDAHEKVTIIADLDDLVSQPVGFKFNGKGYELKPISTENYLIISRAYEKVMNYLKDNESPKIHEMHEMYYEFFSTICPALTLDDVKKMTLTQLTQLIGLLMRHITGQTTENVIGVHDTREEKKKIQMAPILNRSILHRSYRSFVSFIRSVIRRS